MGLNMTEESKITKTDAEQTQPQAAEQTTRRAFVKTSAQVAVTAPAVAVLLSATTKPAGAVSAQYATAHHILDDFTFGNTHEDIDGGPSLDDVT
jgi:hypothetical protein